jgi:hypothetical protein
MPSFGLYARHVKDLELSDVRLDLKSRDLRPAMICEDVDGLEIDNLKAKISKGVLPAWFYLVRHVSIRNSPQFTDVPTTRPSTEPSTMPDTMPSNE